MIGCVGCDLAVEAEVVVNLIQGRCVGSGFGADAVVGFVVVAVVHSRPDVVVVMLLGYIVFVVVGGTEHDMWKMLVSSLVAHLPSCISWFL